MPSASLHSYIEFSTGRAILKGRGGCLTLEVWTGIAYGRHKGDFGELFFPLSKCVYYSCAVSTHTDRQVEHYWSPPGSLLVTAWITTGHRLDHYWWEAVTYTAWRIGHY